MSAATPPPDTAIALLAQKIEQLMGAFTKLECAVSGHIAEERRNREDYLKEHALVVQSAKAAHERIDKLEPRVTTLEEEMNTYKAAIALTNQRLGWIIAIISPVGLAVIAYVMQQVLK